MRRATDDRHRTVIYDNRRPILSRYAPTGTIATVRDAVGNQSLPSLASRVLYDRTPPQVRGAPSGRPTPNPVRTGTELTY